MRVAGAEATPGDGRAVDAVDTPSVPAIPARVSPCTQT